MYSKLITLINRILWTFYLKKGKKKNIYEKRDHEGIKISNYPLNIGH